MANKNPTITKEFKQSQIKAIGINEKLGDKVFGVRFPLDVESKLLSMPQKERVPFIRDLVIRAVRDEDD